MCTTFTHTQAHIIEIHTHEFSSAVECLVSMYGLIWLSVRMRDGIKWAKNYTVTNNVEGRRDHRLLSCRKHEQSYLQSLRGETLLMTQNGSRESTRCSRRYSLETYKDTGQAARRECASFHHGFCDFRKEIAGRTDGLTRTLSPIDEHFVTVLGEETKHGRQMYSGTQGRHPLS